MAIVDEIRRLLSVQPFEPFTIVTSAGNRYEVVSPDHAHTNPQRTRAIVYFDDGTYVIASVCTSHKSNHASPPCEHARSVSDLLA